MSGTGCDAAADEEHPKPPSPLAETERLTVPGLLSPRSCMRDCNGDAPPAPPEDGDGGSSVTSEGSIPRVDGVYGFVPVPGQEGPRPRPGARPTRLIQPIGVEPPGDPAELLLENAALREQNASLKQSLTLLEESIDNSGSDKGFAVHVAARSQMRRDLETDLQRQETYSRQQQREQAFLFETEKSQLLSKHREEVAKLRASASELERTIAQEYHGRLREVRKEYADQAERDRALRSHSPGSPNSSRTDLARQQEELTSKLEQMTRERDSTVKTLQEEVLRLREVIETQKQRIALEKEARADEIQEARKENSGWLTREQAHEREHGEAAARTDALQQIISEKIEAWKKTATEELSKSHTNQMEELRTRLLNDYNRRVEIIKQDGQREVKAYKDQRKAIEKVHAKQIADVLEMHRAALAAKEERALDRESILTMRIRAAEERAAEIREEDNSAFIHQMSVLRNTFESREADLHKSFTEQRRSLLDSHEMYVEQLQHNHTCEKQAALSAATRELQNVLQRHRTEVEVLKRESERKAKNAIQREAEHLRVQLQSEYDSKMSVAQQQLEQHFTTQLLAYQEEMERRHTADLGEELKTQHELFVQRESECEDFFINQMQELRTSLEEPEAIVGSEAGAYSPEAYRKKALTDLQIVKELQRMGDLTRAHCEAREERCQAQMWTWCDLAAGAVAEARHQWIGFHAELLQMLTAQISIVHQAIKQGSETEVKRAVAEALSKAGTEKAAEISHLNEQHATELTQLRKQVERSVREAERRSWEQEVSNLKEYHREQLANESAKINRQNHQSLERRPREEKEKTSRKGPTDQKGKRGDTPQILTAPHPPPSPSPGT